MCLWPRECWRDAMNHEVSTEVARCLPTRRERTVGANRHFRSVAKQLGYLRRIWTAPTPVVGRILEAENMANVKSGKGIYIRIYHPISDL